MDLWMPGAEQRPEGNGGTMAGGPPRAIWHITWDQLGAGGRMPSFDAIANYLKSVDFCPHLMWDPWTGRIVQFYPANQSARAVRNLSGGVETNRAGRVCIQVEVFFSPGAVVGGKRYATVADTPCKGLAEIVDWMRSWGVPDVWPLGWPQWSGNSRNAATWRTEAGHYGHCHVPENDHTDPGPMPRHMFQEDDMPLSAEDIDKIAAAVWKRDGIIDAPPNAVADGNKFWTAGSYEYWSYQQGTAILSLVTELAKRAQIDIDEAAVAQALAPALLAALTPQAIADAISADVVPELADELARRMAS